MILLAKNKVENKVSPKFELLQAFYGIGYDETALVELIGLVSVIILTNYIFAATNIPIDFPLAEPLN